MATEKQIAANRENSKRSTGPRTLPGKKICAQNARRHRHLTEAVLLSTENPRRFHAFVERFYREYHPQGPTQQALVDMMATARWRLLRMVNLEGAGVDKQYDQLRGAENQQDTAAPPSVRTSATEAYSSIVDNSRTLDVLNRLEARLQRQFDSAFDRLRQLRLDRDRQAARETDPIPPPLF